MTGVQTCALPISVKNKGKLDKKVYVLPHEVEQQIAATKLESMNVSIDTLTEEQVSYLNSWETGT